MSSPALPRHLRRLRLTPLATALLLASPAYALDLPQQVITGNPLGAGKGRKALCEIRPYQARALIGT